MTKKIPQFYTATQVCKKLAISRSKLSRMMSSHQIKFIRLGKTVHFSENDLIDLIYSSQPTSNQTAALSS